MEDRREIFPEDFPVGQRTTHRCLLRIFLRTEDHRQIPPKDLPIGWRTADRSFSRTFLRTEDCRQIPPEGRPLVSIGLKGAETRDYLVGLSHVWPSAAALCQHCL